MTSSPTASPIAAAACARTDERRCVVRPKKRPARTFNKRDAASAADEQAPDDDWPRNADHRLRMTTPNPDDKDRATAEAARWLIALEEEAGDEALRARFEAWLTASPANADAWANTSDVYDMMAKTPAAHAEHWAPHVAARGDGRPATAAGKSHGQRPDRASRRRTPARPRIAPGAAAAALAACLAIAIMPSVMLRLEADYATSTAELRSIQMADGSTVYLAPDSAIAIDGDERRVRLVKGEAFFKVAPDADHPFTVAAREVTTTVLGTAFNVRLGNREATVAVREGRVRVHHAAARPSASQGLQAGDWVRIGWNGSVQHGTAPPDEAGSWMQGQIVARDRPLADVVNDLRRYHVGAIFLTDSDFGAQRVSGVYNLGEPVAALQAIAAAHGGVARAISPWVLVVSPR